LTLPFGSALAGAARTRAASGTISVAAVVTSARLLALAFRVLRSLSMWQISLSVADRRS
jgi:hypothetical protein